MKFMSIFCEEKLPNDFLSSILVQQKFRTQVVSNNSLPDDLHKSDTDFSIQMFDIMNKLWFISFRNLWS